MAGEIGLGGEGIFVRLKMNALGRSRSAVQQGFRPSGNKDYVRLRISDLAKKLQVARIGLDVIAVELATTRIGRAVSRY